MIGIRAPEIFSPSTGLGRKGLQVRTPNTSSTGRRPRFLVKQEVLQGSTLKLYDVGGRNLQMVMRWIYLPGAPSLAHDSPVAGAFGLAVIDSPSSCSWVPPGQGSWLTVCDSPTTSCMRAAMSSCRVLGSGRLNPRHGRKVLSD